LKASVFVLIFAAACGEHSVASGRQAAPAAAGASVAASARHPSAAEAPSSDEVDPAQVEREMDALEKEIGAAPNVGSEPRTENRGGSKAQPSGSARRPSSGGSS
jgi:hypothetical protein